MSSLDTSIQTNRLPLGMIAIVIGILGTYFSLVELIGGTTFGFMISILGVFFSFALTWIGFSLISARVKPEVGVESKDD